MAGWDDRTRAGARPIDGRYPQLAIELRRLLGWTDENRPFLTTRMASRKTGISYATISTMAKGDRAGYDTTMAVAVGLNGDPETLLKASGYELPTPKAVDPDPIGSLGSDIDISVLNTVPYSDDIAATASPLGEADGGVPTETLADILPGETRAIRVKGNCMEPYFSNGDIVLIRATDAASSGDTVIATLENGTVTCKTYRKEGLLRRLVDAEGNGVEAQDFKIHGIVEGSISLKRRR